MTSLRIRRATLVFILLSAGALVMGSWLISTDGAAPDTGSKQVRHNSPPQSARQERAEPGAKPSGPPDRQPVQGHRGTVVRFQVQGIDTHEPVAGVELQLSAGEREWAETTDANGSCEIVLPSDATRVILDAKCGGGFVVDTPRVLSPLLDSYALQHVSGFVLSGDVRDPSGRGVEGARIFLLSPRGLDGAQSWPQPRYLGESDASGAYRFRVAEPWPEGSSLVATLSPWIPACRKLVALDSSTVHSSLDLEAGGSWRVIVMDESGRGFGGCRLRVTTLSSPVLDGWQANEVPANAGGDLGIVSRSAKTNADGVAIIDGWPVGREARVRIFATANGERWRVAATDHGEMMQRNLIRLVPIEGGDVSVSLTKVVSDVIVARGQCVGFSEAELSRLRLERVGPDGGNERVIPKFVGDGRFEARFTVSALEDRGNLVLELVAKLKDSAWSAEVGLFALGRGLEIDGLIVSK